MQIAHFTNNYYPVINGVVRSVSAFRKALTSLGNNVFIFAQEDEYQDQEPFIFRYPSFPLPISVDIPAAIPISPNIDWVIPKLKLEVIHCHHPILIGQVGATKAKKLGFPLVFTFHTQYHEYTHYVPLPQDAVQEFLKEAVHDWLQGFMRRCHHIVVPSESMLELIKTKYGLESQYTVIPTGIELDAYQNTNGLAIRKENGWENDTVMISVGRLAKEKNWRFLLRAAANGIANHPNLRVVLLGDGPERKNLENYSRELGIEERVSFLGNVPFEQVPSYLKASDFFGFSSTTETQGLVTLEALAAGLPVVAVNASGTRDIAKNGVHGFLVDEDIGAFVHAIDQFLLHPEMLENFREQALARAKELDIKNQAKKLFEVYKRAIEDKNANKFVKVSEH